MAVLNVAESAVAVVFDAPGNAAPDQLATLVHELSTGEATHVWLAARAESPASNSVADTIEHTDNDFRQFIIGFEEQSFTMANVSV